MPATVISTSSGEARVSQDLFSAAGATDAIRVSGGVIVQATGTGTAVSLVVERSTIDPNTSNSTPNWARVEDSALSGNPATGMTASQYVEPAIAWWRVRVVSVTGSVFVSISGKA